MVTNLDLLSELSKTVSKIAVKQENENILQEYTAS